MDDLAPSLREASRGVAQAGRAGDSSSSSGDGSGAGSTIEGGTVVGRCTAAALSTGVDCVLDEEFSASRDAARVTGFARVRGGSRYEDEYVADYSHDTIPLLESINTTTVY